MWSMRLLVSLLRTPHRLLFDTLKSAWQLGFFVKEEVSQLFLVPFLAFLRDFALPQLGETSDHEVTNLTGLGA